MSVTTGKLFDQAHPDLYKKWVIFVWQDQLSDKSLSVLPGERESHYWGLGDVIRGMLSTASVCDKLNVKFCVDMRHHSFGKYFKHIPHDHEKFVDDNIQHVEMVDYCGMDSIASSHGEQYRTKTLSHHIKTGGDIVLMFTNHMLNGEPNEVYNNYTQQIKQVFDPTYASNNIYKQRCRELNVPDKYHVVHLRLGDNSFSKFHHVETNMSYQDILQKVHNVLQHRGAVTNNTLLISDNNDFLNHANETDMGYIIHDYGKSAHVGIKSREKALENTLVDVLFLLNSNMNHTFTVYNHQSGFVTYTSMLNDIIVEYQNILKL